MQWRRHFLFAMSQFVQSALILIMILVIQCIGPMVPNVAGQTVITLVPSSYVTTSGTDGGQPPASSIDILDESGTTNTWTKYVEFQASSATYAGYQVFTLPTSVAASSITAMQVKVNYQGPDTSSQTWTWQIYNWATSSYTTIGTNAGAPSWGAWQILTFNVSGTFANYVRTSDRQIRLQLLSNNTADNADIDYEAVVVTSSAGVSVSVSPTTATVNTGGTASLTATVTNDSGNKGVTWTVSCSASACGSVSPTATASGAATTYTAPTTPPVSGLSVTVKATSVTDTTKSASSTLTVPAVAVAMSPTSATVQVTKTQQFTATVTGASNTNVSWQVNGVTGGSSATGTVTAGGLYTAPATVPSPATVDVTAVSQADTSKSATATVTVTAAPAVSVSISPTSASVPVNQTQQFTATVTGTSNANVTWQVNGVTGGNSATGTVTTSGVYSAPGTVPSPATVNVTAVSQADTTKSATAGVTVTASSGSGVNYYVSPTGSDSNSGTGTANNQAWKTIQHALNSVHAGDTINVMAGVYHESVTLAVSGSASAGYTTLQNYSGHNAVIDGTGLTVSGQVGLVNISGLSYVKMQGMEIRNYSTSSTANVPIGVYITGADSYVQILNNHIHDIKTSASGCNANALGMAVYGNNATSSINNLTISGNELDHLTTGCSESMSLNGNVQNWSVTGNLIHDNNNIGIDAIGFESQSSDPNTDQARDGLISGNTVYNITSYGNPAYGNQYSADGIYVDGGTRITIERNIVHNTDFAVEVASEHSTRTSSYVTVRNNLIYNNNAAGITIGGYDSRRGGTDHCNFVNNSLYNNDTKSTGAGEFQVQYYATNNVFKDNILYAGPQALFIYNYTNSEANPVDVDYNVYYVPAGASNSNWTWNGTNYTDYSSYQKSPGSAKDAHSPFSNPQYVSLSTPDFHVSSTSPANDQGINLGSSVNGTVDYAGNPRVQGAGIDIGAYEQ